MPWLATQRSFAGPALFALVFVWLCLAIGRRVLIVLRAEGGGEAADRGLLAVCLGASVLQFIPFALGVSHQLRVDALYVALGIVTVLAIPDLAAVARSGVAFVRAYQRPPAIMLAWALALAPAAAMALVVALAPSLDPDGLAYHLTVPKRWMNAQTLSYLPTYPYSNAPMGMEMLFAIGMAFAGDCAAKCIHWALGLLATYAIYRTGKRLHSGVAGMLVASIFLAGPAGVAVVLGYSYVEGGAALATATAALSWVIWHQSGREGYLRCAMVLAGSAVSFKISAALFPVALLALTAVAMAAKGRSSRGLVGLAAQLFTLGLLIAAPMLPWLTRAYLLTGNPVFPVLATKIPSRDLSATLAAQVDAYNRYMTWGNALGRGWGIEQRKWVLLGVGVLWLLCCAVAFFRARSAVGRGTAAIIGVTGIAQLSAAGLYLRYSLPLVGPLLLPAAALFGHALLRRGVAPALAAITLLGSVVQVRRMYLDEGTDVGSLARTIVGAEDRQVFLRKSMPLYPLYERANRDLPADAGVMLSGYCGGFYIDRNTFCAEMVQDSLRFSSWDAFTSDLRTLHVTHIIAPSVLANGGPTPDLGGSSVSVVTRAQQYELVRRLLTQHARPLQQASDQGLYEILPSALSAL